MPIGRSSNQSMHKSVLLKESIDALDLTPGEVFLDLTYGAGGHTAEVRRRFGENVEVTTLDQDPNTGASIVGNFRDVDTLVEGSRPDAILLDLGISSDQIETSGRGFSFLRDEPLDMRMSESGPSASDILNSWDEHAIELVLRGFADEKFSRKIARAIVDIRETKPLKTTFDLVRAVESVKSRGKSKIHPATKTFQAIRIAVNEELVALEEGLTKSFQILKPGGRLAVISFHSLEDRIVKKFFRELARQEEGTLVYKKPLTPTEEEIDVNPRSRSAKLRVIEKK